MRESDPSLQVGSTDKQSVVIAEDHAFVRHAIRATLSDHDYIVVSETSSASQALAMVESLKPDLLLLDLVLPDQDGFEVIRTIRRSKSNTRIVVLSMYEDESRVREALTAGAQGYIAKTASPSEIIEALNLVKEGIRTVPPRFKHLLNEDLPADSDAASGKSTTDTSALKKLSSREKQIFFMLVEGQPNRIIAKKLFISPRTVETHRARLLRKLEADSTAALIKYAIKNNLVAL